jgi:hypothetical protein
MDLRLVPVLENHSGRSGGSKAEVQCGKEFTHEFVPARSRPLPSLLIPSINKSSGPRDDTRAPHTERTP